MLEQQGLAGSCDDQSSEDFIRVRGARTHNLQNIDVDIPRDRLVVITGVSGSGKSSLTFDTIYAEGQRQYVESLSVYARQFLQQLERPDVDLIESLQPTISIDQRAGTHNPRSTVATVTEIYDYLRLLWARVGQVHCWQCGSTISQQTPDEIKNTLLELPEGTKAMILAPLVRGRKGAHRDVLERIRKAGLVRARVDGQTFELADVPKLTPRKTHTIDAVVDRVVIRAGSEPRLAESIRLAVQHADGLVVVNYQKRTGGRPKSGERPSDRSKGEGWHDLLFSTKYACPNCGISYEELEPRSFSFNSPYGACPTCQGLGYREQFDPDLVLPDRSLALDAGAIAPWRGLSDAAADKQRRQLDNLIEHFSIDRQTPLAELDEKQHDQLLHGDEKQHGLVTLLEKEYVTTTSPRRRGQLEAFRGRITCTACDGSRLRREARSCHIDGQPIHHVTALSVGRARAFFEQLSFTGRDRTIAAPIVSEIVKRLQFLEKVGVDYLSLDRPADTLSGGEMQRVRLATGIGSGLVNVCYLLDEPSIGLHPRDNQRLIDALRDLQQQGNTVVVVEHDEAVMRQADHLIDMGPGAGRLGGRVVAADTPARIAVEAATLTGRYLAGKEAIPIPATRRRIAKTRSITLEGATINNLQSVDVQFPLGALVCVTGVSGSGKSSLVTETLSPALANRLNGSGAKPGPHRSLRGARQIDRLVEVDQSPIGRTPRSNPATYTGAFDEIRKVFATTKEARQRGYKAGRFSFNVKGGRCEKCQGHGVQKIEMTFLPDLYVTCDECRGTRFNRQTLAVRYRGLSIADVLELTVDEALPFFENHPAVHRLLAALESVGLGYVTLGQPSTTLSGGEAQRIKLAAELSRPDTGATFYILDEPTTGLHFDDIKKLLAILDRLVDAGNTVLVIEHNLEVVKCADWIIDLGPEGGEGGGRVTATGTPEQIAALTDNHTGRFLCDVLARSK